RGRERADSVWGMRGQGWRRAPSAASRTGRVAPVQGSISPSMLSRSHAVTSPRWSPSGSRLAWIDGFDGRADLVVSPADGAGPPVVVTGECGVGGGFCWASDAELVVGAADGRLLLVDA